MARLTDVQGIDEYLIQRLRGIGIRNTDDLLKEVSTGAGRLSVSLRSRIEREKLGSIVIQADLLRIRGVGTDFAELLEAVGVHSVQELADRNPRDLSDALLEANLLKELVRAVPSEKRVEGWVRQARGLLMGC